jgi:hypothetical protein
MSLISVMSSGEPILKGIAHVLIQNTRCMFKKNNSQS